MFLLHLAQLFRIQLRTKLHLVGFNKALGEQFKHQGRSWRERLNLWEREEIVCFLRNWKRLIVCKGSWIHSSHSRMVRRLTGLMFFILPSPSSLETVWAVEKRTRENREPSRVSPSEEAAVVRWGTEGNRISECFVGKLNRCLIFRHVLMCGEALVPGEVVGVQGNKAGSSFQHISTPGPQGANSTEPFHNKNLNPGKVLSLSHPRHFAITMYHAR